MKCTNAPMHQCRNAGMQECRNAIRRIFIVCICAFLHLCIPMGASAASAQVRDWPSERPPRSLPARDIKFPPYEIQTLPNGLKVVAVLHHEQPAVSMRMIVGTGSSSNPMGKLGLAHLA